MFFFWFLGGKHPPKNASHLGRAFIFVVVFFFFAPGAFTSHGWQLNSTGKRNAPGVFLFVLTVFGPLKRSWVNGSGISFGFCGFKRVFFRQKSEVDARMNGQHHQKHVSFLGKLENQNHYQQKTSVVFSIGYPLHSWRVNLTAHENLQ